MLEWKNEEILRIIGKEEEGVELRKEETTSRSDGEEEIFSTPSAETRTSSFSGRGEVIRRRGRPFKGSENQKTLGCFQFNSKRKSWESPEDIQDKQEKVGKRKCEIELKGGKGKEVSEEEKREAESQLWSS